MDMEIQKSTNPKKKLMAIFNTSSGKKKVVHFGAAGYEDYTTHKDKKRRERYYLRHAKDLESGDPTKAGFLSYFILWGPYTSIKKNIAWYKHNFL